MLFSALRSGDNLNVPEVKWHEMELGLLASRLPSHCPLAAQGKAQCFGKMLISLCLKPVLGVGSDF